MNDCRYDKLNIVYKRERMGEKILRRKDERKPSAVRREFAMFLMQSDKSPRACYKRTYTKRGQENNSFSFFETKALAYLLISFPLSSACRQMIGYIDRIFNFNLWIVC